MLHFRGTLSVHLIRKQFPLKFSHLATNLVQKAYKIIDHMGPINGAHGRFRSNMFNAMSCSSMVKGREWVDYLVRRTENIFFVEPKQIKEKVTGTDVVRYQLLEKSVSLAY